MLSEGTLKSLCKQIELFERAAEYDGISREKVVALGEAEDVYYRLYPHHYRALQTIRMASQLGRHSGGRRDPVYRCESRLISLLMNIILSALEKGDLQLRVHQRPTELAFTLWSLAFGTRALMDTGVATSQLGIENGFQVARDATTMLLDAIGWKPHSSEWNYDETRSRVQAILYEKEHEQNPGKTSPAIWTE